ncbi:hypothetical protein [Hallella colorans]|uniref:hypothetical protein n=1 Tax=Hallella colorans TaxID=1703337 RepID=UPI0023EFDF0E|nr:hypothetical protein [Hallella colorans]
MLLRLIEGNSHALQHLCLPLHGLSHHVADAYRVLCCCVQAVLLRHEVVHGWNEHLEALFLFQEGGHLLCATQLHLVADDAEFLLRGTQLFDALYLCVGTSHALSHDGVKLSFCHQLYLVCLCKVAEYPLELRDGVLKRIHGLCCLCPGDDTLFGFFGLFLHLGQCLPHLFCVGGDFLDPSVAIDFDGKTDLFCHDFYFFSYICSIFKNALPGK